jgi:hypothetical protein
MPPFEAGMVFVANRFPRTGVGLNGSGAGEAATNSEAESKRRLAKSCMADVNLVIGFLKY